MTKDKNGGWSPPEEIWCRPSGPGAYLVEVGYDTKTGIIHIVYARVIYSLAYDTTYYTNRFTNPFRHRGIPSVSSVDLFLSADGGLPTADAQSSVDHLLRHLLYLRIRIF
jgi:hypothetical protein